MIIKKVIDLCVGFIQKFIMKGSANWDTLCGMLKKARGDIRSQLKVSRLACAVVQRVSVGESVGE